MLLPLPRSTLFPYTTLFRSSKSSHTDRLDICECQSMCLHLDDSAYYHNKTYMIDQSIQAGGGPPCNSRWDINIFQLYYSSSLCFINNKYCKQCATRLGN